MNEVQTEAESDEVTEAPSVPGPGHRLRLARERMDMQPAEIAERMHLAESLVVALENDRYAELPDPVFTKGYLRNYARLVDEPVDEILDIYARSHPTAEYKPVVRGTEGKARFKTHQVNSSHGIVKGISWVVVLGLAVLLVVAWRGYIELPMPLLGDDLNGTLEEGSETDGTSIEVLSFDAMDTSVETVAPSPVTDVAQSDTAEADAPQSTPTQTEAEPVAEPAPPAEAPSDEAAVPEEPIAPVAEAETPVDEAPSQAATAAPQTDEGETSGVAAEETAAADSTPETATASATQPGPPSGDRTVALEFSAPCWVDVRDAKGEKVLYGGRGAGERHVLEGEPPYRFVLGNNTAVRITVGGQLFDTGPFAPNGVARFMLDPADVSSAPAASDSAE